MDISDEVIKGKGTSPEVWWVAKYFEPMSLEQLARLVVDDDTHQL
jgi:hypothetical protein